MRDHLAAVEDRLVVGMADAARGPKRNGMFALWLFVRQCGGALPPYPLSEPSHLGRLDALEHRLSSLSLPAPLRRALPASIRELRSSEPDRIAVALGQLAAPARDSFGASLGDAILTAARTSRQLARGNVPRGAAR